MSIYSASEQKAIKSLFEAIRSFYYGIVERDAESRTDEEWIPLLVEHLASSDLEVCGYDQERIQFLIFQRIDRHGLRASSTVDYIARLIFGEEFVYALPVILRQISPAAIFYTYLHIPKTAGTYVEHVLQNRLNAVIQYRPEYLQRYQLDLNFPSPAPLFLIVKLYEYLNEFGVVWITGHSRLYDLSMRIQLTRSPKNFTILREPTEIIVSAANHFLHKVRSGVYSGIAIDEFASDPESLFFHKAFIDEFQNPIKTTLSNKEMGLNIDLIKHMLEVNQITVLRSVDHFHDYMKNVHGEDNIENTVINRYDKVIGTFSELSNRVQLAVKDSLINFDLELYSELG